jgi:hypothetical protein
VIGLCLEEIADLEPDRSDHIVDGATWVAVKDDAASVAAGDAQTWRPIVMARTARLPLARS